MNVIKIANDFSKSPGPRYKWQGRFSGQKFREDLLIPELKNLKENEKIAVDLDGTDGYVSSFLDEAFGVLIDLNYDVEKIKIISREEPRYKDTINYVIARHRKRKQ